MSSKTTNYNLHKIDLTDAPPDITVLNQNWDTIDSELKGHTHNYAGSSSVGGAATSANKLNTNDGSATNPVYFANGVPVKTTYTLGKSVPSDAVFTDTTYSAATTSVAGLMSASDKSKLDGIATGANKTTVDSALSSSSTNPVQNKVVNSALAGKADTSAIPTKTSQLTNDSGFKTTDNNTTYSLTKSGSTITLTGSDGSTTSVTDSNTTYSLSSFGVTATAAELNKLDGVTATTAELNYVDGVTSNIQTQLNAKAASSHTHDYLPLGGGTVTGTVVITQPNDADGTRDNSPALMVGGERTGTHMEFDANEIIAKSNATTLTTLYLNSPTQVLDDADVTLNRVRNIRAGTSDMTAGSSTLYTGQIYLVYE